MGYCQFCGDPNAGKYCGKCGRPQGQNAPRSDIDYDKVAEQIAQGMTMDTETIFEGNTWPAWICSPLCCRSTHWKITNKRIDWEHGCCGAHSDTMNLTRVKDMAYRRGCLQTFLGRGSVIVWTDANAAESKIVITKAGAKKLYHELRAAWTNLNTGIAG
eukprot:TRINITY_DN10604_c0_g1_i4.p1 TRINITY_DN10604_c0_g1~~TRINITY_DN10604_c0_g1_i4.p1  ORF type:complete len:182 (+),score=14.26 TRINITY_DN10604_c0_g1_i4:70-546(+)